MTKVIYTDLAPADGFTLCPWLIMIKPKCKGDIALLAHEMVHVGQMQKVGLIRWWWQYLTCKCCRETAEVEAYRKQISLGLSLDRAAQLLSSNYRLQLTRAEAIALLTAPTTPASTNTPVPSDPPTA